MNLKNILFFISFSIIGLSIFGQDYHAPVDFKMLLSGTFGELRSNHFHSGIDIKTEGVQGQKVYAIADGYVSRIKVSTWGYGKALYITHADGNTSVYAHLKIFNKEIDDYVIENQYKKESFEIQLFPLKDRFQIKKGDIIALSGNTGGSAGAHLHFEIRNTKSEHPLNPLQFGFDISDDIKPTLSSIKIYPIDGSVDAKGVEKSFKLKKSSDSYTLIAPTPRVKGKVTFSISAYDKLNGTYNKNGIYSIKLFVDSLLIYHFQMDEFDFAESRYINAHIDYREKRKGKTKYHRCYKLPNNRLSVYKEMIKKGVVDFKDDTTHLIQFQIMDFHKNTSYLSFEVKSTTSEIEIENPFTLDPFSKHFSYMRPNLFKEKNFQLHMESYSLYEDLDFEYSVLDSIEGVFGKVHHVHYDYVPVHKSFVISLKASIPEKLKNKVYIAKVDKNNHFWHMGGGWRNGIFSAKVREFGDFCIVADTINPNIKGVNIYPGKNISLAPTIKCNIDDKESGIKTFRAEIDGKWVLMEYDYKRKLLTYIIQQDLEKGKHTFKLEVSDKIGNSTTYKADFVR